MSDKQEQCQVEDIVANGKDKLEAWFRENPRHKKKFTQWFNKKKTNLTTQTVWRVIYKRDNDHHGIWELAINYYKEHREKEAKLFNL